MEFTINSLKSPKIGKLKIDTLIAPQGPLIHEKTQTKKSHATVPLSINFVNMIVGPSKLSCYSPFNAYRF